jgi:hypothetical protein
MSGTTSDKPIADKPVANAANSAEKPLASAPVATAPVVTAPTSSASKTANKHASAARAPTPPQAADASTSVASVSAAQRTLKCPKCGTDVREVARFCQRCHQTMLYECPSCHHQQRKGGQCEECGIDFLKYIAAVVSQKQAQAGAIRDRLEQRSNFMKNLLYLPFTLGFPIIRDYFVKRDRKK